jgi:hypothetical protein
VPASLLAGLEESPHLANGRKQKAPGTVTIPGALSGSGGRFGTGETVRALTRRLRGTVSLAA